MPNVVSVVLGLSVAIFAALPASNTYKLNNYSVGPGGTNSASSSTYKAQGNVGEQANGSTSGTTYTSKNGAIQAEQLNVPPAPTLDTGSNTYYNKLGLTINTGSNPSDATYSVAISTNNFVTTNYVQADGTVAASPVYQQYSAWGGAGGTFIVGLAPSTSYKVKVDAKQGMFTNTAYGAAATAATVAPTLSFSVSPNSSSFSSILPNTIATSSNMTFGFSTNGASGGNVYVRGSNGGFKSPSQGYLVSAVSANLSSQSQGFGIQAANATQTSGGPLSSVSPFNGTGNTVGAESTTFARMFTSPAAISGGSATANVQVKVNISAPAVSDYGETFTFIASASF